MHFPTWPPSEFCTIGTQTPTTHFPPLLASQPLRGCEAEGRRALKRRKNERQFRSCRSSRPHTVNLPADTISAISDVSRDYVSLLGAPASPLCEVSAKASTEPRIPGCPLPPKRARCSTPQAQIQLNKPPKARLEGRESAFGDTPWFPPRGATGTPSSRLCPPEQGGARAGSGHDKAISS
jgi:hypothetical protein